MVLKVSVPGSVLVPLSEPAAQRRESQAGLRVAGAGMMVAVVQSGFSAVAAAPAAGWLQLWQAAPEHSWLESGLPAGCPVTLSCLVDSLERHAGVLGDLQTVAAGGPG